MGSSPASSYRPLVRPAELADRDALVSLAETALALLDNQRGGDVFRHRDARPSPAGPTIDAELAAAMKDVRKTVNTAERTLAEDSPLQQDMRQTLRELTRAAGSLRILTDYLERHPESLVRGKPEDKP